MFDSYGDGWNGAQASIGGTTLGLDDGSEGSEQFGGGCEEGGSVWGADCDCDGNQLDECGVCGGSGIPEGDCDCNGNQLDECGVCGGDGSSCACDGAIVAISVGGGSWDSEISWNIFKFFSINHK